MKIAGIRELRANSSAQIKGKEPVIVTRHGKISGLYLPLEDPYHIPDDIRTELARVLGRHLAKLTKEQDLTEKKRHEDFRAYRRSRR